MKNLAADAGSRRRWPASLPKQYLQPMKRPGHRGSFVSHRALFSESLRVQLYTTHFRLRESCPGRVLLEHGTNHRGEYYHHHAEPGDEPDCQGEDPPQN
jgi:hypothetical protein